MTSSLNTIDSLSELAAKIEDITGFKPQGAPSNPSSQAKSNEVPPQMLGVQGAHAGKPAFSNIAAQHIPMQAALPMFFPMPLPRPAALVPLQPGFHLNGGAFSRMACDEMRVNVALALSSAEDGKAPDALRSRQRKKRWRSNALSKAPELKRPRSNDSVDQPGGAGSASSSDGKDAEAGVEAKPSSKEADNAMPFATEEEWQKRTDKRKTAIALVKASAYYGGHCDGRREPRPQTPDPEDRRSKRAWEAAVLEWRVAWKRQSFEDNAKTLVGMGFEDEASRNALEASNDNLERAIAFLCGEVPPGQ